MSDTIPSSARSALREAAAEQQLITDEGKTKNDQPQEPGPSRDALVRLADDLAPEHWLARQLPSGTSLRGYAEDQAVSVLTRAAQDAIDDAGLSRSEVAQQLGVTRSYVSQLLNGSANMTLKTLGALLWVAGQQTVGLQRVSLGATDSLAGVPALAVEVPSRDATLAFAREMFAAIDEPLRRAGYLVALYGSVLLRGAGGDVDLLLVPWRPDASPVDAIRIIAARTGGKLAAAPTPQAEEGEATDEDAQNIAGLIIACESLKERLVPYGASAGGWDSAIRTLRRFATASTSLVALEEAVRAYVAVVEEIAEDPHFIADGWQERTRRSRETFRRLATFAADHGHTEGPK